MTDSTTSPRWYRDSALVYGAGLGVLSSPVTFFMTAALVGPQPDATSLADRWFELLIVATGALGMLVGGAAGYALTRRCGRLVERLALLVPIVVGIAFATAAFPFIVVMIVGALIAWFIGVTVMGVPALILTAAWSVIYLKWLGPEGEEEPASIFRAGAGILVPVLLLAAFGLATGLAALGGFMASPFRSAAPVEKPAGK